MIPRTLRLTAVLLAALLALAACSGSDDVAETSTSAPAGSTADSNETVEASEEPAADVEVVEDASTDEDATETTADSDDASSEDTSASSSGGANTTEVVAAADALLSLLSDTEQATLLQDYGDASLTDTWSNLPACNEGDRPGLKHGDLSDEQLAAVLAVIDTTLSDDGYLEYTQIIAADDVLGSSSSGPGSAVWNSECYYLAFYGTPSTTTEWAMMFGGHHYARMLTYTGDVVTITPAFTGVEPISFEVDGVTVEPMADETDGIFAVFATFDDTQASASFIDAAFDDVLLGPGEDDFPETFGLAGSDLSDDQKTAALAAISTWVDDFDASVADSVMATVEAEFDDTYFAWATSIDPDTEGAYGRIDGPSLWIELVNQAGVGTDTIHHHSIYRHKTDDYGTAG